MQTKISFEGVGWNLKEWMSESSLTDVLQKLPKVNIESCS